MMVRKLSGNLRRGIAHTWRTQLLVCITLPALAMAAGTQADTQDIMPMAGEAARLRVHGEDINIPAQDQRHVNAWDLGVAATPAVSEDELVPLVSLYFLRHPDDRHLLRATVAGAYNDFYYAASPGPGWEGIFTFENFTVPSTQREYIDGEARRREELRWGYVRAGLGTGRRWQVGPEHDNQALLSAIIEPGYLYFGAGRKDADNFSTPNSTEETRLHLQGRYDRLRRNLLGLAQDGYAAGTDLIAAHRANWDDWGPDGNSSGAGHQDYLLASAYVAAAEPVPGIRSPRHRLVETLHAAVGSNLDRFSAPRLGGGPQDDEYAAISRPVVPGATLGEFYPTHYVVGTAEYRYAPVAFTQIGLRTSLAWLDRDRLRTNGPAGPTERQDDVLASVGVRVTTGFFGNTRLQLESNYNTELVRNRHDGGVNALLHVSKQF